MGAGLRQLGLGPGQRVLIYGIGNRGRQDDGLGVRLIEKLEEAGLPGSITLEANYQLNVEDALLMSEFDVVLFADASAEPGAAAPFSVAPVRAEALLSFSSHAMGVSGVLSLCEGLYGRKPRTFLMALAGYEWDISEELSARARQNLDEAFARLLAEVQCMRSR